MSSEWEKSQWAARSMLPSVAIKAALACSSENPSMVARLLT